MIQIRKWTFGLAAGAASLALTLQPVSSQSQVEYPVDTVHAVTYSSVGGGTDVFLREMSKFIGPILGANMVVENVTGAGGAKALTRVARAPADGSVVLGTTITIINTSVIHNPQHRWDNLDMIMMYALDPTIAYVNADSPFKTLKDLIDYGKANPGKLNFGIPNPTAMDRWVVEQMKKKIPGFDANIVSFEGGGDVMLSVLNGTVDVANGEPGEIRAQVEAGKLRPLAVWTKERLDIMPDLPTAKEAGVDLIVEKFRGLAGPKGMPQNVLDAWYKAMELAMQKPEFKAWLDRGGVQKDFRDQAQYTAMMTSLESEMKTFFTEIGVIKK